MRGLSRRHGSVQQHTRPLAGPVTAADIADASGRQEQTVFVDGLEYGIVYRGAAAEESQLEPLVVVLKDTRKFVDVITADAETTAILGEGVSTITAAGRFVLLASAVRPVTHTTTNNMIPSNDKHVVWFRGGANSRKFTITVTDLLGVDKKYEYTTLPAYYEGVLDTSTVAASDPEYGKKVNDIVNAYNTAVNQHISAVAKDIAPANIATKLAALMVVDYPTARADGSYVILEQADVIVTAEDGGNSDFVRVVSQEVTAAELVTPRHFAGKVVKVVPKSAGSQAFYLKAESVSGGTGFGEVVWKETAGLGVALGWLFCIGLFKGGKFYVGRSTTSLATLTGEEVPDISEASSGDADSNPIPEFMERTITHMRMFQDRLMIVAGSTVFLSKSGDYFNFFRKSVLTVADDDPIEVFAQGTEDDVITGGVQHDRNVILCGKRYQYIVPGRENMTPRNPYVGVQATYEGANLVQHAVAGSLLFFCQRRENRLTLQRMQPGAVADRLDALDVSSQLDGYLTGTPRQIVAMTAPGVVFLRTSEAHNGFYVYSYLDSEDNSERIFDSWSRWEFDASLGSLVGLTPDDSGLLAVTVRELSSGPALVLDRFVRETGPSELPYLDSMTPAAVANHVVDSAFCAFADTSPQSLLGLPLSRKSELLSQFPTQAESLYAGTGYTSSFTLTSPYIRDRDDKIILDARVTVSKLTVSLSNSVAMTADVTHDTGKTWKIAKTWLYRPAGAWVLATQGVAEEATVTVPVMKENKTYRARISSKSWLPMTVASVEWSGQAFTSRR